MAKIVWDKYGERFYETGVSNVVLFPMNADKTYGKGVAWNGVTAITQSSSGGEIDPFYMDNVKYFNKARLEEFSATIEAIGYPDEFVPCDGSIEVIPGVFAGQQPKKSFGLVYRTNIGNDIDGQDHGYKLHFIYNATASSSDRSYETISDSSEVISFSWDITTVPVELNDGLASSYFVIDSRKYPSESMESLENTIYGLDTPTSIDSRLPLPSEFIGSSNTNGIYSSLVNDIFGNNLIAHWPLNESSGTVAADASGNFRIGTYSTGVQLGVEGIEDGDTASSFNGTDSYINIYSSSLSNAFNSQEGTIIAWLKPHEDIWSNHIRYSVAFILGNNNNNIEFLMAKSLPEDLSNNDYKLEAYYTTILEVGGNSIGIQQTNSWFQLALSWSISNHRCHMYLNGSLIPDNTYFSGVWQGSLMTEYCYIGFTSGTPDYNWLGSIAHVSVVNREATASEILTLFNSI